MVRKLIGVFNRKMTEKELDKLQGLCKDMNITPVEDGEYDDVLWWLNEMVEIASGIDPSLYQFQEGRYMEMLYVLDAKLVFAYELEEDVLEKLSDLKECADRLACIDDSVYNIRDEIDAHESQMEELLGVDASLDSGRAFVILSEHLSSDRDQIYEAAQEIFEANRYRFETSASKDDEPGSEQSSVAN
jgi:hypothetical protein